MASAKVERAIRYVRDSFWAGRVFTTLAECNRQALLWRDQVAHPLDGFGALVPAAERRSLLGVLFSSTLFPGRAPAGHVALTVFAGGMRQPDTGRLATPALLAHVLPDDRCAVLSRTCAVPPMTYSVPR